MKPLLKGTAVKYSEAEGRWRIEYHYGKNVYRIGTRTEFCDLVPGSKLTVIKKKSLKKKSLKKLKN